MEPLWKIIGRVAGILMSLLSLLFVVYFWNLDKMFFSLAKKLSHR